METQLSPVQWDGGPDFARVRAHREQLGALPAQVVDLARVGAFVGVGCRHGDEEGPGGGVLGHDGRVQCPEKMRQG